MNCDIGRMAVCSGELDLAHSLTPGQSFRWKMDEQGRWTGVVRRRVVTVWRDGEDICHTITPGGPDNDFIRDYFHLDTDLSELYRAFVRADPRMAGIIRRFSGLRVLRQEPEETLLSYVCSSANSVTRICGSVELMARRWGDCIAEVDGQDYFAFPTAQVLAAADPDEISSICCLGFRGRVVKAVAGQLVARSVDWLSSLRSAEYERSRDELVAFQGVGRKIADCVLLFSLDKHNACPVDTHVRQMAVMYYLPEFKQKTLTPAVYQQIVEHFQSMFGPYAGWAQEYLFYDHLMRSRPDKEAAVCS